MNFDQIAWRGFVTENHEVIAWPVVMGTHSEFLQTFHLRKEQFVTGWRQLHPGTEPDFDPGAPEWATDLVRAWLQRGGTA